MGVLADVSPKNVVNVGGVSMLSVVPVIRVQIPPRGLKHVYHVPTAIVLCRAIKREVDPFISMYAVV